MADEPGRKMGRPSKLTEAAMSRILNAIRCGATLKIAAESAGIGTTTFFRWMVEGETGDRPEYRDFREQALRAEAEGAVNMLGRIVQAAQGTGGTKDVPGTPADWRAAAWILERRHAYHKAAEVHVQGTIQHNHEIDPDYVRQREAVLASLGYVRQSPPDSDPTAVN